MTEFFDWTTLATFAGCLAATGIITQFVKETKPLKNIATQWVSYFIALILLFAATYFTGGLTTATAAIIPFNAIAIALGANGAFSAIGRATSSDSDINAVTDTPVMQNEATDGDVKTENEGETTEPTIEPTEDTTNITEVK